MSEWLDTCYGVRTVRLRPSGRKPLVVLQGGLTFEAALSAFLRHNGDPATERVDLIMDASARFDDSPKAFAAWLVDPGER